MVKKPLKNIFQGSTVLVLVLILIMFVAKTEIDSDLLKGASVAAVPMGWNVDRLRSEIAQAEKRYENFYYDRGRDPNSNFMRRQEANIAAMKARQYDLEFQKLWGTENPFPYKPENYTLANFVSDGNPTPSVYYEPKSNPSGSNIPTNSLTSTSGTSEADQSEKPWAEQVHHQGEPWGGLVVYRLECTCEMPNYAVFLNDYVINGIRSLKVDYSYSGFHLFYDLNVGQYGLGTFDPSATCSIRMGTQCVDIQLDGVINRGPGFGSSGFMGLSFPSILGSDNLDFMNGGTVPGMYTF